jgi:hypothetical protein
MRTLENQPEALMSSVPCNERLVSAESPEGYPAIAGRIVRYGVVRQCRVGGDRTSLEVENAVGERAWLTLEGHPERAAVDVMLSSGLKPLSIKLVIGDRGEVYCSVICTSSSGPSRHEVPLALALALCVGGHHTIVTRPNL